MLRFRSGEFIGVHQDSLQRLENTLLFGRKLGLRMFYDPANHDGEYADWSPSKGLSWRTVNVIAVGKSYFTEHATL